MRRLIGALIVSAWLVAGGAPSRALGFQADKSAVPQVGTQDQGPTSQAKPANTNPPSQDDIDKLVQERIREALGQGNLPPGDRSQHMDPETEKAIATAAQKFLEDPAIKEALAEKIKHVSAPWESPAAIFVFLVPISFFALIGLLVWLAVRSNHSKLQAQMAAQAQLLAKFASGAELAAFLASPGGQQMLGGLGTPPANPRSRVLKHVGFGAVLATLGFGMLAFGHGITFPGVVILSAGVGFLVSAAASYSLAKKMGLLNGDSKGTPTGGAPQQ
jgi:hypothetical protein